MWRLKQLIPKDQAGLEGKTVDVGSFRLQIRSTIAQGGFARVYLTRDSQSGKLIALKHIICADSESFDLVKKEVLALKAFRGHPNIIKLEAQSVCDTNGIKECFLAMEYCEKMMVEVLDKRGAGHYEEKQLLLMFRDICNAVYAMHSAMPPMAHRDLKPENLLLGSDGHWKLCDFGSISTNHRRVEKADDMGLEEDIIRKHTTPTYRAPEMWDLYRRDIICEKVDIWALGCLLYRMAYFKNAFDGESKLQILNGNYRLPDLPRYSPTVTSLIMDMLNSSPEDRPMAMQVWERVNNALSVDCRRSNPDRAPSSLASNDTGGNTGHARQSSVRPTRRPTPQSEKQTGVHLPSTKKDSFRSASLNAGKSGSLGSFWATQYAQGASDDQDQNKSDNELVSSFKGNSLHGTQIAAALLSDVESARHKSARKGGTIDTHPTKVHDGGPEWDDDEHSLQQSVTLNIGTPQNFPHVGSITSLTTEDRYPEFVADFQRASIFNLEKEDKGSGGISEELESLRAELKRVRKEVLDVSAKCEKLGSICESQHLEVEQLKAALASVNSHRDVQTKKRLSHRQIPSLLASQRQEQAGGPVWDVEDNVSSPGFSAEMQEQGAGTHWDRQCNTKSKGPSANEPHNWNASGNNITVASSTAVEDEKLQVSTNVCTGGRHPAKLSQPVGWSAF